jgi:hypothetical protein
VVEQRLKETEAGARNRKTNAKQTQNKRKTNATQQCKTNAKHNDDLPVHFEEISVVEQYGGDVGVR